MVINYILLLLNFTVFKINLVYIYKLYCLLTFFTSFNAINYGIITF